MQQSQTLGEIDAAMQGLESSIKDVSQLARQGKQSADDLSGELISLEEQTRHFSIRDVTPR